MGCGNKHYRWVWKHTLQMDVETNTTDGCGNKHYRWVWKHTLQMGVETHTTDGCGNKRKQTLQMGVETNGNKRYRLRHDNDATDGRAPAVLCSLRPGCIRDGPLPLIHNRHQQLHCRQQTLSSHSVEGALPQWTTGVEMSRYRLM